MNIQELFRASFLVLCDRRERFAGNETIPNNIRSYGLTSIDSIICAMKNQNSPPFTLEKCFLADLAVMMTRAWEAYSIDESGQIIFNYLPSWI